MLQLARTPEALDQRVDLANASVGSMIRQLAELNGIAQEEVEGLRLVPSDPSTIISDIALDGILNWPLIEDLKCHILINETSREFVLSDHPVFRYNWYLRNSKDLGAVAIVSRGVQFFLPLSDRVTYCLYDGSVYKYGHTKCCVTILNDSIDTSGGVRPQR